MPVDYRVAAGGDTTANGLAVDALVEQAGRVLEARAAPLVDVPRRDVVCACAEQLLSAVEGVVKKKAFTALGASEFVRDVGCAACRAAPAVQAALGRVGVPLRSFDRLKQTGIVLNAAAVTDVQHFQTRRAWNCSLPRRRLS